MTTEPADAFPYLPPSEELKSRYPEIFFLASPLPVPFWKAAFDRVFAITLLFFSLPVVVFLFLLNLFEGLIRPENRGPLFYYYWSIG